MTTSALNRRRRRRAREDKRLARRRMRRVGGDWKFDTPKFAQWAHPNWQYNRDEQGKDHR